MVLERLYAQHAELVDWVVPFVLDDLLAWNDWFWTHRRPGSLALFSWGSNNVSLPFGCVAAYTLWGARYESGLDQVNSEEE